MRHLLPLKFATVLIILTQTTANVHVNAPEKGAIIIGHRCANEIKQNLIAALHENTDILAFNDAVFAIVFPYYTVQDPRQVRLRSLFAYLQQKYADFVHDVQRTTPLAFLQSYRKMYHDIVELYANVPHAFAYLKHSQHNYTNEFEQRSKLIVDIDIKFSDIYLHFMNRTYSKMWTLHERAAHSQGSSERYQREFNRIYRRMWITAKSIQEEKVTILTEAVNEMASSVISDVRHILKDVSQKKRSRSSDT